MIKNERLIRFDDWKEMLEYLHGGADLYNPQKELYAFEYNDAGAIASYGIDVYEAIQLTILSVENGEYWAAYLGPNGDIWDDPDDDVFKPNPGCSNIDFCKMYYEGDWLDVTAPKKE